MPSLLLASPWKRGFILLGAFAGLWAAALYWKIPGNPFGNGSLSSSVANAMELGGLGVAAASSREEVCGLTASADGALLATGTRNGYVQLWDAGNRSPRVAWKAHETGISAFAFSPDCRTLLTSGDDLTIARWAIAQADQPQQVVRLKTMAYVTALAMSPTGRMLAVACGDRLAFRDPENGELLPEGELCVPGAPILALAFTPDGTILAAGGGGDNAIRVWGLTGARPVLRHTLVRYEDHWLRGLAYADDGATLVSVDTLGRLVAWDRLGHIIGQARAGRESCLIAALGGQSRLVVTKDVSNNPPLLWQLSEHWWH